MGILGTIKDVGSLGELGKIIPKTNPLLGLLQRFSPNAAKLKSLYEAQAQADPALRRLLTLQKHLDAVGMTVERAKDLAGVSKGQVDSLRGARELARGDSILGKLTSNTLGQLLTPMIAMGLVTGVGLAGRKAFDVLGAGGVNIDPSARLASSFGLQRIVDSDPTLREIDPVLLRKYYELIFSVSPSMTKDVKTTANLLKYMIHHDGPDASFIKMIADAEKGIREPEKRPIDMFQLGSNIIKPR